MKTFLINMCALAGGFVIGYFLIKGIIGLAMLLYLVLIGFLWVCVAFCILCVITLPITLTIWAVKSLIKEVMR